MSVAVGDVKWGAIPGYFEVLELLVAILQQVFEWHLRQNVMADVVEKKNQDHRAGLPFKVTHKVNTAVMECSYTVVKGNPAVLDVFLRVAIENLDTQCARKVDRVLDQIRQWFFMSLQHHHYHSFGKENPKAMHFHPNFDHTYFFGAVQALLESAHVTILKRTLHFLYDFCPTFIGESRIDLFQSVLLSPRGLFPRLFLHWNSEVRDAFFFILVYKIIPLPPAFAAPGESGREKICEDYKEKLLSSPLQLLCNVLEEEIRNSRENNKSRNLLTADSKRISDIRPNKASKILGKPVQKGQDTASPKKHLFPRKKQNLQQDIGPAFTGSYKSDVRESRETLKVIHSHLLAQLFAYPKSGTAAISEPLEVNERLLVYAPAALEAYHKRLRDFLKQIGTGVIEIPPNLGLRSE